MKYRMKSWLTEKLLQAVVRLNRDSAYIKHLRNEVPGWFKEEGPNRWIAEGAEQLLAVFSHHGHSGGSFGFAIKFFETMASFKPWGPLTGEESEWTHLGYSDDMEAQNKRCGHVFRRADGTAYDSEGRVFRDPDGACYTSAESCVEITFPYTPQVEYVERNSAGGENAT